MGETIKKHIKWTLFSLRMLGLYTHTADFFREKYYWMYTALLTVAVVGTYNFFQIMYVIVNFRDVQYLLSHAFLTLTFTMTSIKTFFYLKNWPKIRKLIDQLQHEDFQPKNDRQAEIFETFFLADHFIHILSVLMVINIAGLWALIPFLVKSRTLPFPYWLPFDYHKPIIFELVYLHQSVGLIIIMITNVTLDLITFGFTSFISTECDLLSDILANMYEVTEERLEKEGVLPVELSKTERDMRIIEGTNDTLMYCIKFHWKIIGFAEEVNSFFTVLLFIQFGSSLLSMCMTMYGLTNPAISITQLGIAGIFLSGILNELMFFCYFGNAVIEKSTDVGVALYNTPWVDCSKPFKDNLLFFMLRTRRPIRMLALNFFEINLPTFVWILRSSWSVYVVLSRTTHKNT